MDARPIKIRLAQFGRAVALLLNRAMMYQESHPVIQQSVIDVLAAAQAVFSDLSQLVFILNREQFYVDEELLDPRMNVARISALFKANGIQSISFEKGVTAKEIELFIAVFSTLGKSADVEILKKSLENRGVFDIKINHVFYQKVTADDQVVSRDALKQAAPLMDAEDRQSRKKFMDTLLESVLTEEFAKTLTITSLMANPGAVSQTMIAADLAGTPQAAMNSGQISATQAVQGPSQAGTPETAVVAGSGRGATLAPGTETQQVLRTGHPGGSSIAQPGSGTGPQPPGSPPQAASAFDLNATAGIEPTGHGHLLLHQLELMQSEVQKHLQGEGDVNLSDLAEAVFDMKKQLLEGIQAQKALGVAYANEAAIVDNANQLSDQVLIQLIRKEYQSGRITTTRLDYLIKRLVPEAAELKRLLPRIKSALLGEGMPINDYLSLLNELRNELQNDDLIRILQENSETIGVDGAGLIAEVQRDPAQAAKLIYLASEIRKSGADESALTDILVEYIEQQGNRWVQADTEENPDGETHLKQVITEIESSLLHQLGRLDVNAEVLTRMEQRLNQRMDAVLDKMRVEWLHNRVPGEKTSTPKPMTLLQTLEYNVRDNENLQAVLKAVRTKVDEGRIEENNFSQIHEEIMRQQALTTGRRDLSQATKGVLSSDELMFILEKEVARTKRYDAPFSALAFSLVSAKPLADSQDIKISAGKVLNAALAKLARVLRDVDYLGQIGTNKVVAVLPMATPVAGKKALERVLRLLHAQPIVVDGIKVQLRVAGVVCSYDTQHTPDARSFAKQLSNQLTVMAARIKSIQVLF